MTLSLTHTLLIPHSLFEMLLYYYKPENVCLYVKYFQNTKVILVKQWDMVFLSG